MNFRCCLGMLLLSGIISFGGEARIVKVLPQLLDQRGRSSINPSLFDRDAYQLFLRENPEEISALRFEIQYKTHEIKGPLTLRLELRGSKTAIGKQHVFETEVQPGGFFSKWGRIQLNRTMSEEIGSLVAWRASLVQDSIVLAEQESFLW